MVPLRIERKPGKDIFSSSRPFFTLNFKQTELPQDLAIKEVPREFLPEQKLDLVHLHIVLERAYEKALMKWKMLPGIMPYHKLNGLFISRKKFDYLTDHQKEQLTRLRKFFLEEVLKLVDSTEAEIAHLLNIEIIKKEKYIIWSKINNYKPEELTKK